MTETLRLGLVAGEASGDNLGAGLMRALQTQADAHAQFEFVGIGGPRMIAAGLTSLADMDQLNVNGFVDPILRLPELLKLLNRLGSELSSRKIDAFIGVDFNEFNFRLEKRLKRRGIPTAHYVSPSVYAWRRGRTRRVARCADMILCLYPFEPAFYSETEVEPVYVGHPLADEIDLDGGSQERREQARQQLGLEKQATVLAVLPGSRAGEIRLMLPEFIGAADLFCQQHENVQIVIPCLREKFRPEIERALEQVPHLPVHIDPGNARKALLAADVALVKSGTSTLEAMLLHRPMVVSYRMGKYSYQLAKRLLRSEFVALPNILAGRMLVPELLQDEATAQRLAGALSEQLAEASGGDTLTTYEALHSQLRQQADVTAARAMLRLLRASQSG